MAAKAGAAATREAAAEDAPQVDPEPLAEKLKALANPVRLRMLECIRARGQEVCVCDFEDEIELTQPTLSHHLKVLREAGLVESRKRGSYSLHRLVPEAFAQLEAYMESCRASTQETWP